MGLRRLNSAVKMFTVMLMGKGIAKRMKRSSKKLLGMKLRGRPKKNADRLTINERRKGSRRKKSAK